MTRTVWALPVVALMLGAIAVGPAGGQQPGPFVREHATVRVASHTYSAAARR